MNRYENIIKMILGVEPTLTGTGTYGKVAYAQDSIPEEEFRLCLEFIKSETVPTSKINKKAGTSYRYKHDVETYVKNTYGHHKYIANGSFIAALIYEGISILKVDDSPNVYAAIKLKK